MCGPFIIYNGRYYLGRSGASCSLTAATKPPTLREQPSQRASESSIQLCISQEHLHKYRLHVGVQQRAHGPHVLHCTYLPVRVPAARSISHFVSSHPSCLPCSCLGLTREQGWDSNSAIYRLLEMAFQLRLLAQLWTKKDMLMYIP